VEPLSIVAFLDGRLGHEKQTRGVIQALAGLTPVAVTYRKISPLSFMAAVKQWCVYLAMILFRQGTGEKETIDLIIGSGTYTHIPMLLLKKTSQAKTITCMCPDILLRRKMDLCLVPEHDQVEPSENIFLTTGPPSTTTFTESHDPSKGLILIGGRDNRSHLWDSESLAVQVKSIIEKEQKIEWTISSSPRTPEDMILLLEKLVAGFANAAFITCEQTPPGWVEEAYEKNSTVWVTADSINMIFEALTAGCRVGILPVRWLKGNSKFRRAEENLIRKKWAVTYDMWSSGHIPLVGAVRLNEAERCAEEILRRWWPDRLR